MLPYPNGLVINGKRLFGHQISKGDIVLLLNDKTKEQTKKLYGDESGWVKRVIAVSRDTIELKGGIVYLNNKPLKEPYTAKARSTFGEAFLEECKKITVPENSVFVMGDNRKGSGDSREVGFFSLNDINHVIPLNSQKGNLDKNWRDTNKDFEESSKIKINKEKYLEILNEKRKEAKVSPLTYEPKLETSAAKRGEIILQYNDFSFEATKSGYTMARAMSDSKYSNSLYGETPRTGYYEAEELIENQFEFPETKEFLLDPDYDALGIAEVEGSLNGCPTQIAVLHFAGYVPPNYKQSDIDSWRTSLNQLREILPGWARMKEYSLSYTKNKKDIDRMMEILNYSISMQEKIVYKMENNQWLGNEENSFIKQQGALMDEQKEIAKRLNAIQLQY